MYYQQKWVDNQLWYKTTPHGEWKLKEYTLSDICEAVETKQISLPDAINMAYNKGYTFAIDTAIAFNELK